MEKEEILKLLIEQQEKPLSIRQIALHRNINYKSAYQAIQKLHQENIITMQKHGNSFLCQFNRNFNETVCLVEYQRLQVLFKNKNLKILHKRIKETPNPFYCALIFGSYANQTYSKHSDIDLCIITDNEVARDKIQLMIRITPLNIDFHVFTSAEFMAMLSTKKFNVGHEIVKKNIILYGIESYYEMMHHAIR